MLHIILKLTITILSIVLFCKAMLIICKNDLTDCKDVEGEGENVLSNDKYWIEMWKH